jgi:hypothetical protein
MNKTRLGIAMMFPSLFVLAGSFIASIYLAYKDILGINAASPIIIGFCLLLEIIGIIILRSKSNSANKQVEQ